MFRLMHTAQEDRGVMSAHGRPLASFACTMKVAEEPGLRNALAHQPRGVPTKLLNNPEATMSNQHEYKSGTTRVQF